MHSLVTKGTRERPIRGGILSCVRFDGDGAALVAQTSHISHWGGLLLADQGLLETNKLRIPPLITLPKCHFKRQTRIVTRQAAHCTPATQRCAAKLPEGRNQNSHTALITVPLESPISSCVSDGPIKRQSASPLLQRCWTER